MPEDAAILHYVADPMCSWCFGFAPVLEQVAAELPPGVELRRTLGGLAPDSRTPMDDEMRGYVQGAWRAVEQVTGVAFNHEFWERHHPARSTWPACRSVLAAEELAGKGDEMFAAIQRAYYREARDPSQPETLVELAAELGLELAGFSRVMDSRETFELHEAHRNRAAALGVAAYPTLVLERPGRAEQVMRGYAGAVEVQARLRELLDAD